MLGRKEQLIKEKLRIARPQSSLESLETFGRIDDTGGFSQLASQLRKVNPRRNQEHVRDPIRKTAGILESRNSTKIVGDQAPALNVELFAKALQVLNQGIDRKEMGLRRKLRASTRAPLIKIDHPVIL